MRRLGAVLGSVVALVVAAINVVVVRQLPIFAFAIPGLIFAAPVLVSVVVLVQMLYVEDVLGGDAAVLRRGDGT